MTSSLASPSPDLAVIGRRFQIPGEYLDGAPYGSGHINDTYAVHYRQAGAVVRYIFQRINPRVFRDIPAMMHNIDRVLAHQNAALRARDAEDASRRALTLVPAVEGGPLATDDTGGQWRVYLFIEGASTHDLIQSTAQAGAAARSFGEFLALLGDLDGPRLHETIPNFHHTPDRLRRLREAIAADVRGRVAAVGPQIAFALERTDFASTLTRLHQAGDLPERVTHNDTKLNNVMLDNHTGEGLCVIDLDTVMPGFAVNDFGDLGRTAANAAMEDETDLTRVTVKLDVYDALLEGFLAGARPLLTAREIDLLPLGVRLMTYENGVRFLTDHLQGDTYYKIHRPGHNLDRCRNQFKLVAELEAATAQIDAMVRRHR